MYIQKENIHFQLLEEDVQMCSKLSLKIVLLFFRQKIVFFFRKKFKRCKDIIPHSSITANLERRVVNKVCIWPSLSYINTSKDNVKYPVKFSNTQHPLHNQKIKHPDIKIKHPEKL